MQNERVYIRTIRDDVNVGREQYPAGSIFLLMKEHPAEPIPGKGKLVTARTIPVYTAVHLFEDQFETLNFDPSPLYNHAVRMGFKADPRFFEKGVNAILERKYHMVGGLYYSDTLDSLLEEYVIADDECKKTKSDGSGPLYERVSKLRMKHSLLECLQKTIDTYNKLGTIDNYE